MNVQDPSTSQDASRAPAPPAPEQVEQQQPQQKQQVDNDPALRRNGIQFRNPWVTTEQRRRLRRCPGLPALREAAIGPLDREQPAVCSDCQEPMAAHQSLGCTSDGAQELVCRYIIEAAAMPGHHGRSFFPPAGPSTTTSCDNKGAADQHQQQQQQQQPPALPFQPKASSARPSDNDAREDEPIPRAPQDARGSAAADKNKEDKDRRRDSGWGSRLWSRCQSLFQLRPRSRRHGNSSLGEGGDSTDTSQSDRSGAPAAERS